MNKLLIITGPTATGKTALAVTLAKKYNGEIISADSRQVYQKMNFGTGKDLPKSPEYFDQNNKFPNRNPNHTYGFYLFDNVPVWGLDIVEPRYSFSVSDYVDYSSTVMSDIEKRGRLPVIVGGTGLYLRGILGQIDTLGSIFDEKLRRDLEKFSTDELQKRLNAEDPQGLSNMNVSDQSNPRRLVRAIEKILAETESRKLPSFHLRDTLVVVLSAPIDHILEKIKNRPRGEILSEVRSLLKNGYDFSLPSMTSLGYKSFKPIAEALISNGETEKEVETALSLWNQEDRQYAKRQLTFLKKFFPAGRKPNQVTTWIDITISNWQNQVDSTLEEWYT